MCIYSSSIKPVLIRVCIYLSRSLPLPPPPSLSLSLSLSLSKTDHLLTSLASHVGIKDVLEEDKEGIHCEGCTRTLPP